MILFINFVFAGILFFAGYGIPSFLEDFQVKPFNLLQPLATRLRALGFYSHLAPIVAQTSVEQTPVEEEENSKNQEQFVLTLLSRFWKAVTEGMKPLCDGLDFLLVELFLKDPKPTVTVQDAQELNHPKTQEIVLITPPTGKSSIPSPVVEPEPTTITIVEEPVVEVELEPESIFPPLPDNYQTMSVRQLQQLCDRINKIEKQSIQGYRRKGTNKSLIIKKLEAFYSNIK